MTSVMALRLDEQTKRRIARLAARRGTTRSALIREAIAALVEKEERKAAVQPHDLVKDLLGSVRGGDPDRSADVGKKVRRILKARRPRRSGEGRRQLPGPVQRRDRPDLDSVFRLSLLGRWCDDDPACEPFQALDGAQPSKVLGR